jgi:hypothetical protein
MNYVPVRRNCVPVEPPYGITKWQRFLLPRNKGDSRVSVTVSDTLEPYGTHPNHMDGLVSQQLRSLPKLLTLPCLNT